MLLEVSAYPKPGNVHRTRDHPDTRFEHFLAASVACRPSFEIAAQRGSLVAKRKQRSGQVQVGSLIRDAALRAVHSQRGGNTSLGVVTLLIPLAVAAGMTFTKSRLATHKLRRNLKQVLGSTTSVDTIAFYEAVASSKPGGLGKAPQLDVTDSSSREQIMKRKINLLEVFRIAAQWDSICLEWTTNYSTTFDLGYPYLRRELSKTNDINVAIVDTYLRILSEKPDTLIQRKAGIRKAQWASNRAKKALDLGGAKTVAGRRQIERFDDELGINGNLLNPGATADLTASVVALATLSGYRP
jgi:triphosphoribosyl-dephospho-CoA synthase